MDANAAKIAALNADIDAINARIADLNGQLWVRALKNAALWRRIQVAKQQLRAG